MAATILVVDDEPPIVELVRYNLLQEGFEVIAAYDGHEAVEKVRSGQPIDLVILDIMLPFMDGLEVLRILRRESRIPVLILTAKGGELERVLGLEIGADDYVTKPFSPRELVARVKAILRRTGPAEPARPVLLRVGDLVLDPTTREVTVEGKPLELTTKEFELLQLLMNHPRRVFTRDMLLERLWGPDYFGSSRTVDMHISRLREKLGDDPSNPRYIVTVRGVGYTLRVREE
ncbi:MAG: response regulator transcription factor [Armatimonadota bacterium]|nr:response regulator transcription factor [Armatimonadota bacterium]MDR5703168.1 response regulator transcription factor [Armatimonadota bacterium]